MRATSLNSHTKLPFMWVWGLSQGLGIRIKSSCGRDFKFTSGAPALPADRLFEWSFIQSYYVMIPRDMNRILLRYYHLYGLSHYHHTFWWRLQNCSKMTSRKQLFLEVSIGNSSFMSKLFLFSTFCDISQYFLEMLFLVLHCEMRYILSATKFHCEKRHILSATEFHVVVNDWEIS